MRKPFSVLVVDDNPAMADTLSDILAGKGYNVLPAYSGVRALEILQTHPVDILLTDVKMPDMNGVELYRETRKYNPHLTTFLMTAYSADDLIQQGMKEGIKTVLTKPVEIDFLLSLFSAVKKISSKGGSNAGRSSMRPRGGKKNDSHLILL